MPLLYFFNLRIFFLATETKEEQIKNGATVGEKGIYVY
jgi:hypothetical protein